MSSKFSETKFADHAHDVYEKFRNNFKAFIVLFEKAKEEGLGGSSDHKKKAQIASEVQGKIFNWQFALSLSMVIDVYKVYRKVSCILQKVDILPHNKYDAFKRLLATYKDMINTVSYSDCPCMLLDTEDKFWNEVVEEVCMWPRFHQDICTALHSGTYQNINMGMVEWSGLDLALRLTGSGCRWIWRK